MASFLICRYTVIRRILDEKLIHLKSGCWWLLQVGIDYASILGVASLTQTGIDGSLFTKVSREPQDRNALVMTRELFKARVGIVGTPVVNRDEAPVLEAPAVEGGNEGLIESSHVILLVKTRNDKRNHKLPLSQHR